MERNSEGRLRIGILDQSPVPEGASVGEALRNSVDLAALADQLGYERYWVAEHHGTPGLACASPEVLIGPIAAATRAIRVGSGGVMLPHYSPLKVAENFNMLTGMFGDRIDLGIGRAAGTSPKVALALQRDRRQPAPDDFEDQLRDLLAYYGQDPSPDGPLRQIPALPRMSTLRAPELWLLGSSPQSAVWAADLGLPYAFADFINSEGARIMAYYREHFRPSNWLPAPHTAVACWVICAPTDEEALRLSFSMRMMTVLLFRGRLIQVPPVETAERFLKAEGIPAEFLPAGRRIITGVPARIRASIEAVAQQYGADEVLLVNILYDHEARRRSYELVADAFSLHHPDRAPAEELHR